MPRYKNNTLTTVIFRIDFGENIDTDKEELRKECLSLFPLVQNETITEQTIHTTINEKGEATVERQKNSYTNVTYSNRQMSRKVVVSPKFVLIELQDYTSYSDTKSVYMSVFSKVREANPDATIARIGMRYINQIDLSNIKKSTRERYIKAPLLGSPLENVVDGSQLSRTQHLTEIMVDDFRVRCVTGFFNPDFPAAIKRFIVTLDYDAFIQGNADVAEVDSYLDKFHAAIQSLFEQSILQKQKESMVIIDE